MLQARVNEEAEHAELRAALTEALTFLALGERDAGRARLLQGKAAAADRLGHNTARWSEFSHRWSQLVEGYDVLTEHDRFGGSAEADSDAHAVADENLQARLEL